MPQSALQTTEQSPDLTHHLEPVGLRQAQHDRSFHDIDQYLSDTVRTNIIESILNSLDSTNKNRVLLNLNYTGQIDHIGVIPNNPAFTGDHAILTQVSTQRAEKKKREKLWREYFDWLMQQHAKLWSHTWQNLLATRALFEAMRDELDHILEHAAAGEGLAGANNMFSNKLQSLRDQIDGYLTGTLDPYMDRMQNMNSSPSAAALQKMNEDMEDNVNTVKTQYAALKNAANSFQNIVRNAAQNLSKSQIYQQLQRLGIQGSTAGHNANTTNMFNQTAANNNGPNTNTPRSGQFAGGPTKKTNFSTLHTIHTAAQNMASRQSRDLDHRDLSLDE